MTSPYGVRGQLAGMMAQRTLGPGAAPKPGGAGVPGGGMLHSSPMTTAPTTAAPAAPASAATAQTGDPAPPLMYGGKGSGAAGTRKRMMQLGLSNAYAAQGPMWDSINQLINQANTDHFSPEGRAAFLAPRMDAYNSMERQAQGAAVADQAGRGIDDSSYGGAVSGAIGSQFGAARAGAIGSLYDAEQQRQQQSQALLRDLLMGLQGRSSQQASSVADSITNFRLQQQQLDQANQFDINGLVSGIAGLGGAALARPRVK